MNEILMYWNHRLPLSLYERAIKALDYLKIFSAVTGHTEFKLHNKDILNLNNYAEAQKPILAWMKKMVSKYGGVKKTDVHDDFIHQTANVFIVWSQGLKIQFSIGGMERNSLIISGESLQRLDIPNIFKESIVFFEPDWGVVTDEGMMESHYSQTEFWFGWMTYFSEGILLPEAPGYISVEKVSTGEIWITTQEIFNFANHEHAEKAKALIELFRERKIFRPSN